MITDEIVAEAEDVFAAHPHGSYPRKDAIRAALEAVAPALIAAYLRKAATEMGGDSRLEKLLLYRAQELDPK